MQYCCDEMKCKILEQESGQLEIMVYQPQYRAYGYYLDKKIPIIQYISFCPFCGTKFPEILIFEYDDFLKQSVGNTAYKITEDEIPEEFKTDEWWKKRGL